MTEFHVERIFESVRIIEGVTSTYGAALERVRKMTERGTERYEIVQTTDRNHSEHNKMVSLLRRLQNVRNALSEADALLADFGVYSSEVYKDDLNPKEGNHFFRLEREGEE